MSTIVWETEAMPWFFCVILEFVFLRWVFPEDCGLQCDCEILVNTKENLLTYVSQGGVMRSSDCLDLNSGISADGCLTFVSFLPDCSGFLMCTMMRFASCTWSDDLMGWGCLERNLTLYMLIVVYYFLGLSILGRRTDMELVHGNNVSAFNRPHTFSYSERTC